MIPLFSRRRLTRVLLLAVAGLSLATGMPGTVSAQPVAAGTTATAQVGNTIVTGDLTAFTPAVYVDNKADAKIEVVKVTGRPFDTALRLTTFKPSPSAWQIGVNVKTVGPIKKGDVLWLTLQSRRIESRQETGEAIGDLTFMQKNEAGKEVRPLERGFSCGLEWIETSIPFVAEHDAAAGESTLAIRFGHAIQSLEVGGIKLVNYGSGVDIKTLPRTVTRYEGHAANAPWRAAAAERIERIRKGDLALKVVDAAGTPVADAKVEVRMTRHAFAWGTAIDAKRLATGASANDDKYREVLEKHFNKIVFENDLKWGRWMNQSPADRANIIKALDWLDARGIPARGHVMIWPSWRQTPAFLSKLQNDPAALRKAIFDHIAEQTSVYAKRLADWDVINETYAHNDVMKVLGREEMVEWFKKAREGAPSVKLFYNDYVMFHGTTSEAPSQYFYDVIKFFIEKGAPIDGIGEQAHFGGNPPGPGQIVAALDRFGKLGLPILITEFDVATDDEQLQADFTRDFTTAIFSHPSVTGMVQWGFWGGAHWKPSAALWDKDWTLRPNGKAWVDLVYKAWWTNADGQTSGDGTYNTRGFYGDYDVTVSHAGKSLTSRLKLAPGGSVQRITLK